MPILEAIFIGSAAFSALMGIEYGENKNKKKAPKKKNSLKNKSPVKKKKSPAKKKSPVKKVRGKRWETKLELKKQLSKRGFKFTNAQLEKESITDLRKLVKTLMI